MEVITLERTEFSNQKETGISSFTCGGMAGVGLYWLSVKAFHNKKRLDFIITVLAAVATIVVIGLLAILLIVN